LIATLKTIALRDSSPFQLATAAEVCAELGARLRARRLAENLTQHQMAARAGVSVNTIKKLEGTGQVNLQNLVRVAIVLSVVDELEPVFRIRAQASLADMEKAQAVRRQRASRRGA
jgi:transcriptional regulator with XRE-family HTH domain